MLSCFLPSLHFPGLIPKQKLGTEARCHRYSFFLRVQNCSVIFILSALRYKENWNTSYFFFATYISEHSPCNIFCPPAIFSALKSDIPFFVLLLFPPCFLCHLVRPFPSTFQVPHYCSPSVYTFLYSFNFFSIRLSCRGGSF